MKFQALLIATLLALAGVIGLAFLYPHEMVSPGDLTRAHAQLQNDCMACHAPFRGASPDRCIRCHAVAEIGRKTVPGRPIQRPARYPAFHQELVEKNCMACHSEHPTPAFAQRSMVKFEHGLISPATRRNCQTCHTAPADALHRGANLPCAQCHKVSGWKPATFDHARFFPLSGDHNAPCATCHVGGNFRQYTCFGCHEHERSRMLAEHAEEGIRNIDNCVRCHRGGGKEEGERGERGDDD